MSNNANDNEQVEQMTISLAKDFARIFNGRQSAYGQFILDKGANEAKVKGRCSTMQAPITDDLYLKHLRGEVGLGVVPIKENNTCSFAAIDMDVYTDSIQSKIVDAIYALRAPLVPFKSKSGGLHIFCFFAEEIKASVVIATMRKFKTLLGLGKDVEVFPKQVRTEEGDIGNWINLPMYHAGPECKRTMLAQDMSRIYSASRTLSKCDSMRVTAAALDDYFDSLPLTDAPPCLQKIYLSGSTNNRNIYLFALGRYYKAKYGDNFEDYLTDANRALSDPIPLQELVTTIIASLKKKDYSYTCSQSPLCDNCDKKECAKRKYGIGGKEVSNLSFGEFRQIMTDPPTYEWLVNEKVLNFDSAAAIINQNSFREQCVDKLHVMPNRLNDPAWSDVVSTALSNVKVVEVNPEDDISPGALVLGYVVEFIKKRHPSPNRAGLLRGLVYKDTDPTVLAYLFDIRALVQFLTNVKQVKLPALSDLKMKLTKNGGKAVKYHINRDNPSALMWCMPITSVDALSRELPETPENDFIKSLNDDFGLN